MCPPALLRALLVAETTFQKALYNPEPVPFRWYTNSPIFDPNSVVLDQDAAAISPLHDLGWYLTHLGFVGVFAVVALFGALWLFVRLEDDMAEEI